ncbi:hypothetical protein M0R72_12315 [Candidatus Pacearchaeota archaeon]|nr:hypothetical protein [Candidatus Pacearchaeota archaeon]
MDLMYKATLDVSGVSSGAQQVNSLFGMMGSAAGVATIGLVALTAAAVATGVAFVGAVSAAASWQTMMTDISKTTGVKNEELQALSKTLEEIRMKTGATAASISGSVVTAGSIGIPKEELAEFAVLSQQMAGAFRMSADAAAEGMGLIGNVAKPAEMSWVEFGNKAGSSINALADSMTTTEEALMTGMTHLGATMGLLKPSEDTLPAWVALTATVQSLGLKGDSGGEAIQDALMYSVKNAKNAVSDLLGVSGEQLQLNLRSNAPEVMKQAAIAIKALPLAEQGAALAHFGQTGSKAIQLLMGDIDPLTGGFTKLDAAIQNSNQAFEDGTGLSAAYAESQKTVEVAWERVLATGSVIAERLGVIFLPAVGEALSDIADMGQGVADGVSKIADLIKAGDIKGAFQYLVGEMSEGAQSLGSSLLDKLQSIDYKAIGDTLHYMLVSGWQAAVGLFRSFLSSDVSLTGAFSAIRDVFGPTFEHIFNNLKIAGLETYLSLGDGVVKMANNIGSVLTGAINIAIEAFARLAGAADDALGGAISKLLGLQGDGTSTGTASSSWIDKSATYQMTGTGQYVSGSSLSDTAIESNYVKVDTTGYILVQGELQPIQAQSMSVSANTLTLSASGSDLKSNVLSEMKLHTMSWGEDGAGMGYAGTSDEQKQLATDFKDVKENTDSDGWLGGAIKSIAKGDEQVMGSGEFAGTKAEIEEIPAAYKEVAETTQRKTSNDLDFGFTKLSGGIGELSQIGKDGIKTSAEDNALFQAIVDKWQQKWTDAPLFSETAYGQEIKAEIAKLSQLEEIKDTIKTVGGENREELAKVDSTIAATKEAINNQLAESASGDKTRLSEGLYYGDVLDPKYVWQDFVNTEGGYVGPTKLYPGYEDPALAAQQEAAAINDKYGIGGLGSIGSVTIDTTTGAIPVHVESSAPGVLTTQDATSQKATGVTDQTASSSQQLIQSVTQGANNIINTMKSQGTADRTTMLTSANVVSAAMSSNAAYLSYSISAAASSIVNALYEVFGTMQSFASGGYVDRPTLAIIGDAPGGEYVVPASEHGMVHTTALHLDTSGLQTQVNAAIGNVSVSPIYVPVQVVVDIDSSQVQNAVHQALAVELDNLRL